MHTQLFILVSFMVLSMGCSSPHSKTPTPLLPNAKLQVSEPLKNEIAIASSTKETMKEPFTCKRETDIRSIWIESLQPDGCKLWYSNYSKKGPAAWSQAGLKHCQKISENVRKNLESTGFSCQSAESTTAAK